MSTIIPAPQEPHHYYPEMGGKPAAGRLLYSPTCYRIQWLVTRDEEAQALFKKLRIRPSRVRRVTKADLIPDIHGNYGYFEGEDFFEADVTSAALPKIQPWVTSRALL